jgi:DNA polymerase III alpha subunit (gram-positive type)
MLQRVLLRYKKRYILSDMGKSKYLQSPRQLLKVFSRKTILIFDTETTGLFSHVHQITEIAAEVIDGDSFEIIDSFHKKVILNEKTKARIECEKKVINKDPKIFDVEKCLKMNGYNPDDPDLKNLNDVLIEFSEFCEKHNSIIVCQNAVYDLNMVNTALKKFIPRAQVKYQEVYDTKLFFSIFVIPALTALKEQGNEETKQIIEAIWDRSFKVIQT